MSLQHASFVETYFDIGSGRGLVVAELSILEGCDAWLSLAIHGERRFQPGGPLLTGRERRVLSEISRGANNKQVARLLEISPSTVRTHVESIFRKLECSTRAAATFKAARLGLIF